MKREVVGEAIGTGLLLFVIVGSGIAAQTLSSDDAVTLFTHAVAVGVGLGVLIIMFQTISGAHFNPAVTLAFWRIGGIDGRPAAGYVIAQLVGAVLGVVAAHITFGQPLVEIAQTERSDLGLVLSEFFATFVLVLLILILVRTSRPSAIPAAVGAWVAAIVFATSSTGFANPAVTIARMFTDTFTGIEPLSTPLFVLAQLLAALLAARLALYLVPVDPD